MTASPVTDDQLRAIIANRGAISAHAVNLLLDQAVGALYESEVPSAAQVEGFRSMNESWIIGVDGDRRSYAPLTFRLITPDDEQTYGTLVKAIRQLGRLPTEEEGERIIRYFGTKVRDEQLTIHCLYEAEDDGYIRDAWMNGTTRFSLEHMALGSRTDVVFVVMLP